MPTLADLDAAMLRPGRAVPAVARLGGGAIAMAATGQPWRLVGTSAAVYQLRQPSGRVLALRCPLAERRALDPTLAERYRALAADPTLVPLRDGGLLVGDLRFVPDGLTFTAADLRSAGHPVIAMEWVPGPTLLAAADRACRADDRPYLAALADAWVAAVATVRRAGVAHGDLAADNALVRPAGGIVLVDYDTCVWPGSPRPTPGAPGTAPTAAYAHPSGPPPAAGAQDAFAALVIYASLRVLAVGPDLRQAHGDPPGRAGGALLFTPRDLRDPDASPLFGALRAIDDPPVRRLVGALRLACLGPPAAIPPLDQIVAELRNVPGGGPAPTQGPRPVAPAAAVIAPARPPVRAEPDERPDAAERQRRLTRLNSLLLAGDEEGARRFWTESGLAGDPDAVRELGPRMAELERRRLLRRAREAAESGDSAALLRIWDEGNFEEFRPAAPLLPLVEAARRRARSVDRLRAALDAGDRATVLALWPELRGDSLASSLAIRVQSVVAADLGARATAAIGRGDDEGLLAAVAEAEAAGSPIDPPARRAARAAAARAAARRELRDAVEADDRPALAALAVSGRLDELGRLEPRAVRAVLRALAWPMLERVLATNDDAAILAAYDEELFAEEGALSRDERSRIDLARARAAWLERVRGALRRRDAAALRAALVKTPPGAERRLSRVERGRIERLTARDEAVERLATALRDGPDAAIVEALGRVETAGAALPEALDWAAVRGVVDRASLANAIREAAAADPPDYGRLARLLPAARAAMVEGSAGIGGDIDFARLEADILRAAHLARLREALAADDDAAIAAAAVPDPFGALARLAPGQRARIERALAARHPGAMARADS